MDPLGLWGVRFGEEGGPLSFQIGRGNPWLHFTAGQTTRGLQAGLAAVGETFGVYDARCFRNEPGFGVARGLATVGDVALVAAGAPRIIAGGTRVLSTGWTRLTGKRLYRAVGAAEMDDIARVGAFRPHPGGRSMSGKWFAASADDAMEWAKQLHSLESVKQTYMIVEGIVPRHLLRAMEFRPMLDGIGPAWYASGDLLRKIRVGKIVNSVKIKRATERIQVGAWSGTPACPNS